MNFALRCLLVLGLCISLQSSVYAVKSAPIPTAPTEKVQQEKRTQKQLRKQRRVERKKARKALRKQLRQARRQSSNRLLGFLSLALSLGSAFMIYLGGSLSMALFGWLGLLLMPVVFVISIIALTRIKKNPGKYQGKGMAIAGLIYSSIMIVLVSLTLIVLLSIGEL